MTQGTDSKTSANAAGSRPRINLTMPPVYVAPPQHTPAKYSPAHYFQQLHQQQQQHQMLQNPLYQPGIPITPGSPTRISLGADGTVTEQPDYTDYYSMYPAKAGEFMFKQFEGFRDFTVNTAKSGLGVGEKSVFWMYTKISRWSRSWFTHFFLFLILFLYSVAGAALFIAVEGDADNLSEVDVASNEFNDSVDAYSATTTTAAAADAAAANVSLMLTVPTSVSGTHEKKMETNVNHAKRMLAKNLRILALDREKLENPDPDIWEGRAINLVEEYSAVLYQSYKEGSFENKQNKKTWSFWNAVFYCGTIYTTIDDSSDGGRISDTEVRKRRERIERFQSERSRENADGNATAPLQANLQRFNEERRKFELEKLKFLQEKRELDRMRLRRFEKYREELLEEQSRKLKVKLQEERAKSIEATPMPPLAPSVAHRSRTPTRPADSLSPAVGKKKILIVPKARSSSRSASTSEDEGRLSSDEGKKQTIRRRFSPRKPKRPRSAKLESGARRAQSRTDGITSPESELPSDYQPEEPEIVNRHDSPEVKEPEMVITHRRVVGAEEEKKELEIEPPKASLVEGSKIEDAVEAKIEEKKEIEVDKEVTVEENGLKVRQRRRPLVLYVEQPEEVFTWRQIVQEWYEMWQDFLDDQPAEIVRMRIQVNHCLFYFAVMVLLCGLGGIAFRLTEGTFESQYKCGVKRVKREFIDQLWLSSHNQREEDWKLSARNRLRKFEEELQIAFEAGMKSYSGNTAWNFVNGVIYSLTVVSTIGYGHISPSTTTGRALTILYAIIGIPIFLIVLADFGKLFTRGIKFMWAYVRRLYYTGSFRKVRKTAQVQEVMKGLNVVYDMVRRPSTDNELQGATTTTAVPTQQPQQPPLPAPAQPPQPQASQRPPSEAQPAGGTGIETIPMPDTPTTPVPETFEIDDEFNLPISVAIVILVAYMLFGANIYCRWENWSFFEAFYFVFISISTIGFGDYVPQHPIYMMCSILYLIFGLALTSMCINVVQLKLSDSFRQASAKIGATIGLQMAEAASQHQHSPVHTPIELAAVHTSTPTSAVNVSLKDTPTLPARPSTSVPKPEKKE